MSSTLTNFISHVVFSTKNRKPFLGSEARDKLYPYIGGIIRGEGGESISIGGTADHVHILCKSHPSISFSNLMQKVKGNSSRWFGEQSFNRDKFSWQRGYAAFSVSQSMVETVARYIQKQEEHHTKTSFKEELIEILNKHGVEYDERYLFD